MTILTKVILSAAAFSLAACGGGDADFGDGRGEYELPNDFAIGNPDAAVTVVEYASVSCGACGNWANTVYPEFKEKYIDTGEVRYVFRPFPAGSPQLYLVGTSIAVCADEKTPGNFFPNIKLQFEKQNEILRYAQLAPEQLRDQYTYIAEQGGLTEAEMEACLANDDVRTRIDELAQVGMDEGIPVTPSFTFNGKFVPKTFELAQFDEQIALAKGEDVPTQEEVKTPLVTDDPEMEADDTMMSDTDLDPEMDPAEITDE
jgi:protein-disulfide isomerase